MATTSLIPRITTNAQVNNEVRSIRDLSVEQLATTILYEGKPVSVWQVTAKLENGCTEQASAILDKLTAKGTLARFRAGFSNYYASPRVALTEKGPALGTVISDSLKSLFLGCQCKVMGKLKG